MTAILYLWPGMPQNVTCAWWTKYPCFILDAIMNVPGEFNDLLLASSDGDEQALGRLSPFVYQELRRLAQRYMAGENARHTLQATALVNEALIRLVDGDIDIKSRKHFFVIAARMMRRVLVDHARAKNREKRGGGACAMTFADDSPFTDDDSADLPILMLDEALSQLAEKDQRMAHSVELIYFGGLSVDDAAEVLGVSSSTVYEEVRFARAWLKQAIS
jgi:RNA polymerase sigma factor (TIGR02999 family)